MSMTQNQLAYMQQLETHRANVAKETEDRRYHTESLSETIRSNLAKEQETHRYNTEYLSELVRSNKMKEQYNLLNLSETRRHNQVTEGLTAAQNKLREFEANNALQLGLGNLANTREYNMYQNELAQQKLKTEQQNTRKVKREADLTGAKVMSEFSLTNLRNAQTVTENSNRTSQKVANYLGAAGNIMRGVAPIVKLFVGG